MRTPLPFFSTPRVSGVSRVKRMAMIAVMLAPLSGCMPKPSLGLPDASVLSYDGKQIVPPDCDALERHSLVREAGIQRRPDIAFGCATYTNLAAQIARPADLVSPLPLGPADAAVAASAVRRYETGTITPIDTQSTMVQPK
ncbi:Lipoprotein [Paraburkholderia sabiae]|uniref:CpaD family pilus assembly lipoprotein n=1 Tax=Paraburkholderia sabiae TaxID=273251 RepID=UPI001CB2951C|nr:CpaD family pilus assembly lipoprotein [Paraburkholderia sabiae]CAG9202873.1 Lipoprotein [Paraburkholderia sabiae]